MTLIDSDPANEPARATLIERIRRFLHDGGDESLTRRLAGTVFAIRVISAGLAYVSQVLLARWMGSSEYGIYVYVWTWVLLLGSMMDFGMSVGAQKFIPQYRAQGDDNLLRGFLTGSRWMTFGVSSIVALMLAGLVTLLTPLIGEHARIPFYLGCLTLPAFVVANNQDGIARSYDWMRLALMPQFIVRQTLLIGFAAGAFAIGFGIGATLAMAISAAAVWCAMIGQMMILNRRLGQAVPRGPKSYAVTTWLSTSVPIMIVEGFYLLLSYIDVLVLQIYSSPKEVGIYFAAAKTLALVSFIHYAMSATTAHRFSTYHASGDHEKLESYLAHAIKWTFWPSLAATLALLAVGKPMLWLFGPDFTEGHGIMFLLAVGLLARSAIGPVERLLNMLGHQGICAAVYAAAFVLNLVMCFVLIPRMGAQGAAISTSLALVFETALLFYVTKRRLNLHVFVLKRTSR